MAGVGPCVRLLLRPRDGERGGAMTQSPIWPLDERTVSAEFGRRWLPLNGGFWNHHTGRDFAVPPGTPVKLVADGRRVDGGVGHSVFGSWLEYDHGGFSSRYHGLTAPSVRSAPASAQRGAVIGYSSQPGVSTGPHVHFELRVRGRPIDPRQLGRQRGSYRHSGGLGPLAPERSAVHVDGVWGAETITAVQRILARTQSVTVDGRWGVESVTGLQRALGGAADGVFGPDTVRRWQRRLGVTVDGRWGRQSVAQLQRVINQRDRIFR